MRKIDVIIKRPDEEYGHKTCISDRLENLQRTVGGYIEFVNWEINGKEILIICNEEGKLLGLEPNIAMGTMSAYDEICGTIIVCGRDGEDITDIPISFQEWKEELGE